MDLSTEHQEILVALEEIISDIKLFLTAFYRAYRARVRERARVQHVRHLTYSLKSKIPKQIEHLRDLISYNDQTCIDNFRMCRNAFARLCFLTEHVGGLVASKNVKINEQVAIFLIVLSHHTKNRIVKCNFKKSGYTISKHFNKVLEAVLKLHTLLLSNPHPVPEDCTDEKCKWFKGCLNALDGTYIPIKVPLSDKARYRNRKGVIAVNVLGVCDRDLKFQYVLTGWEGSAADSRVLRNAIHRPNGLKIPNGNYYLCDAGYTNGNGFLAPFRGVRYHLREWDACNVAPQNPRELYNRTHARARNCIERSFGLLKMRWAILRSPSFYPVEVHNRIIMACCLIHNFIRMDMPIDPLEHVVIDDEDSDNDNDFPFIDQVEPSQQWTNWRDNLAGSMYDDWRGTH